VKRGKNHRESEVGRGGPENWRKKSNTENKRKNNARRIWLIDLKRTASPPLSNNGAKIG